MAAEIGEAQSILLPGGGRLGYREFGDPEGVPCVYTPSYTSSSALGALYDAAAREGGVRWIAVDRAGLGASSPVPEPSLRRHAEAAAHLADHLGLTRFSVVGEHGGDSHALATAHHLPDRVDKVLLISGNGPLHSALLRSGLPISLRLLRIMAKRAPGLFRGWISATRRSLEQPEAHIRKLRVHPAFSSITREGDFTALVQSMKEGMHDVEATRADLLLVFREWSFPLAAIRQPVELWHSKKDSLTPVAGTRRMAEALPAGAAHLLDGGASYLHPVIAEAVMASIRQAASTA